MATNFEQDLRAYQYGFTGKMVHIWEEKLLLLGVYRSGALLGSLYGKTQGDLMTFRFLQYGVYVDSGVGYLYRGHAGDIEFLDEAYRFEHDLDVPRKVGPAWGGGYTSGKPRQKKPWFNKKFFASTMKLKADLLRIVGDNFIGIVQSIETKDSKKSSERRPYGIELK